MGLGAIMDEQQKRLIGILAVERTRFMGYIRRKAAEMSPMDAEDILAEVSFDLFDKADIFRHVENLTAYIYRALANRITDYRRRKRVLSLDYAVAENGLPLLALLADPQADPGQALQRKVVLERLYEAIGSLEPRQRAVWIATEIEGYSFRELAGMWDEPVGTLLSRKNRAVKALRAMLSDVLEEN